MLSKLIDVIKLRRVFGAASHIDWQEVRAKMKGMINRHVYAAIYLAARSAPTGDFGDIGPAQGGTTIALTLGHRDSGLAGKVYSNDRFAGSAALLDRRDQAVNVEILKRNVADLGARAVVLFWWAGPKKWPAGRLGRACRYFNRCPVRQLVNNTQFAEKRPAAPWVNSDEVRAAMLRIREEILSRFNDERRNRQNTKINPVPVELVASESDENLGYHHKFAGRRGRTVGYQYGQRAGRPRSRGPDHPAGGSDRSSSAAGDFPTPNRPRQP
jgi:hypothetical protein